MVFKILLTAHRKAGVTPAEFKDHYENTHLPLIKSITGPDFPISHSRSYIERSADGDFGARVFRGTQADFDMDVVAELAFEDMPALQRFFAAIGQGEGHKAIKADEEKFLDSERMKVVLLGESHETTRN